MSHQNSARDVKVAVIGCGHWGKNLIRNFKSFGALACVHDVDAAVAQEAARAHGVPVGDPAAIYSDPAIQGVVLSTPAEFHAEMAEGYLAAGKHVFVEKPLALTLPEAETLCGLAEDKGLVLMVGHLMRYHPAFEKLITLCRSGVLGAVQYVYSHRLNLGRIRTVENILWSFAPHDISMILELLGDDPHEVSASGHCYLNHDVLDVTTTHLGFAGKRAAHIFVSWLHPFKEQRLVVVGEEGMAMFDDGLAWSEKLSLYPHKVNWENGTPVPAKGKREVVPLEEAEPLRQECRHFLDCVAAGEKPRTDGREGQRVLRVLHAAQRSIDTGKVQRP